MGLLARSYLLCCNGLKHSGCNGALGAVLICHLYVGAVETSERESGSSEGGREEEPTFCLIFGTSLGQGEKGIFKHMKRNTVIPFLWDVLTLGFLIRLKCFILICTSRSAVLNLIL